MAGNMVPYSNPSGKNQTSPSASPIASAPTMPGATMGSATNPFTPGVSAPGTAPTPTHASGGTVPGMPSNAGSLYDSESHYSSGETDIKKQLVDIYGKGTGGFLDNLLKNMSGEDSAIFQQFLASMKPVEASERAGLNSTLGSMGIGPQSSVTAIANSNLSSQFNAQAAQEDSQLMQQQLQDTIGIITGTEGASAKETASSGWDVFGKVVQGLGEVGGEVLGAASGAGGFSKLFS